MKVCFINPGLLSIPPKGWGAIEKYIFNYTINLQKMGHIVDLKYSNDPNLNYDCIVVFVYNQAINLYKRGIPYIFSYDDVHPILLGKESQLYQDNLLAMQKSMLTIIHGKFLKDEFSFDNMVYLPHGVNTSKYLDFGINKKEHRLLCMANDIPVGRKGFHLAIQAAMSLDLPITIAGPDKNKNFFDTFPNFLSYDKLTILDNLQEDELIRIMNEHTIFVHPSSLETGVPNLTIVEAFSCGLPVVGTYNDEISGLIKVELNVESVENGIKECINNYEHYKKLAKETSRKYDWEIVTKQLEKILLSNNYYSRNGLD